MTAPSSADPGAIRARDLPGADPAAAGDARDRQRGSGQRGGDPGAARVAAEVARPVALAAG
ncbi:MAG: hypothetical protein ACK4TB_15090 [Gemmobacter sp.]